MKYIWNIFTQEILIIIIFIFIFPFLLLFSGLFVPQTGWAGRKGDVKEFLTTKTGNPLAEATMPSG